MLATSELLIGIRSEGKSWGTPELHTMSTSFLRLRTFMHDKHFPYSPGWAMAETPSVPSTIPVTFLCSWPNPRLGKFILGLCHQAPCMEWPSFPRVSSRSARLLGPPQAHHLLQKWIMRCVPTPGESDFISNSSSQHQSTPSPHLHSSLCYRIHIPNCLELAHEPLSCFPGSVFPYL